MSIKAALIISCDGNDCDCQPFGSTSTSKNVARKQAADLGWVHRPTDETDWSPAHVLIREVL